MKQGRLVVVSNRLPALKEDTDWKAGQVPLAGGLVSALLPAMSARGKGIWLGWSGRTTEEGRANRLRKMDHPLVHLIGMDLEAHDLEHFYNGFCNRTLWPMFHCFQTRVRVNREEQNSYFRVNEKFGQVLAFFLEPRDLVWVHDYHMVPLGQFLRQGGWRGRMGFFLHIPFPPLEMIELLPDAVSYMKAWLAYDVVGFHTERYRENYFEVMSRLKIAVRQHDQLLAGKHRQRVLTIPIGIDPSLFAGTSAPPARHCGRMRNWPGPPGCKVILGVDRLDYSKGIPERIKAIGHLLRHYPRWRRKVCLIQICSPSRTRVKEYREQKEMVDTLVGRINAEFADHDWYPIYYLYRTYDQAELVHFYRRAAVALVTPLRDGMNLVAMEFVAAQDSANPGVLVLSKFAGVAEYFPTAIQVNPYLIESVSEGLDRALAMSLAERKTRHQPLLLFTLKNTANRWARTFIHALTRTPAINRSSTRALSHNSDASVG